MRHRQNGGDRPNSGSTQDSPQALFRLVVDFSATLCTIGSGWILLAPLPDRRVPTDVPLRTHTNLLNQKENLKNVVATKYLFDSIEKTVTNIRR
jgi:hypothetical protein